MKLIDYNCSYENNISYDSKFIKASGLDFPELHHSSTDMFKLSKLIKNKQNDNFCSLPFCHTLEGEALGGIINLGDAINGPRVRDYICKSSQEILDLQDIDFSKGRIYQVLEAVRQLITDGEEVVFMLSGPFTILNVLVKPRIIFKTFKKEPEVMQQVFDKLQKQLLLFTKQLKDAGVRMISYADSSGGLNILGPKFFNATQEMFTIDTLKKMSNIMGEDSLIHLCPKTTLGLISSEKAEWDYLETEDNANYRKSITSFIGQTSFIGETCLKDTSYKIKDKKLKTIILKG